MSRVSVIAKKYTLNAQQQDSQNLDTGYHENSSYYVMSNTHALLSTLQESSSGALACQIQTKHRMLIETIFIERMLRHDYAMKSPTGPTIIVCGVNCQLSVNLIVVNVRIRILMHIQIRRWIFYSQC